MTPELQDLLLHELGGLMYSFDHEQDYFKRRRIHQQIVHVNGLLGFEAPAFRNSLTSIVCQTKPTEIVSDIEPSYLKGVLTTANTGLDNESIMQSKTEIRLQDIKDCIAFPKDSPIYNSLVGMCDCWYSLEKKKGSSDSEAAISVSLLLGNAIVKMANQ